MVEQALSLDSIFGSLADPTRRDIIGRVADRELSVGEIAGKYDLSLAAISKHLKVLEKAKLIIKQRRGRQQYVTLSPAALANAEDYLRHYAKLTSRRLDSLEEYISKENQS